MVASWNKCLYTVVIRMGLVGPASEETIEHLASLITAVHEMDVCLAGTKAIEKRVCTSLGVREDSARLCHILKI